MPATTSACELDEECCRCNVTYIPTVPFQVGPEASDIEYHHVCCR